jgi:CHAD domain-containing protein
LPNIDLILELDSPTGVLRQIAPLRPTRAQVSLLWHDSPDGALAARGLALEERRQGRGVRWRLLRTRPEPGGPWLPGQPAVVLQEAAAAEQVAHGADALVVVGQMTAVRREVAAGDLRAVLLDGTHSAGGRVVRLRLRGPAAEVEAAAREMARTRLAGVPRQVLAAPPGAPPRRLGPAGGIETGQTVGAAFAHLLAQLTDVMLHHALLAAQGDGSEPVHQLRVAVRRLRSVIGLFRSAVACDAVAEAEAGLRALAAVLGPARDWDVFLAGTGAQVAAVFEGEPAMARLLAAAGRRRVAAYAALRAALEGPAFRELGVALACLAAARPWPEDDAVALPAFAAKALRRRARKLKAEGDDLAALPETVLHETRLRAKRLRYACEVFAPLFAGRHAGRMVRRLTAVQEALGHLNDASVAAALMAELGPAGRGRAGGLVRGYVAGRAAAGLEVAQLHWKRWRAAPRFWAHATR